MSASTCPYCGAETRPGDNFCLNCGNRLLPSTPSPQQAVPAVGESTIPAQEGWSQGIPGQGSTPAASGQSWSDAAAPTLASSNAEPPTIRGDSPNTPNVSAIPAQQNSATAIEQPAKFILRAENGDVLQEYPLEKPEISIGRAPNSDILLSKDKLTSRRHATVRYEDNHYVLVDERSANGTFVNGEQLEEMAPHVLQDGDHVGIGEHELIFRGFGSNASNEAGGVADMPTVSVPFNSAPELTYRTRDDEALTATSNDDFSTKSMENGSVEAQPAKPVQGGSGTAPVAEDVPVPAAPTPPVSTSAPGTSAAPMSSPLPATSGSVVFNRLTDIPQPTLPDIAPLLAALSTLDGQVMSLQEQLNATQEAIHNHEAEVAQISDQLRSGVRRVSERMDSTIADIARSREALAWSDLLQLMEDVMNNPRDIDYISKLGRKARELNKVFQLHQSVLNTLAECNSLLRSLIGDDRRS